jgi:hypothetical protein
MSNPQFYTVMKYLLLLPLAVYWILIWKAPATEFEARQ